MIGDLNRSQELAILNFMTKVTSLRDFQDLLDVIVHELPMLVGALGCWIYLQPEFVPEYDGVVQRGEKAMNESDFSEIFDDFIVLAATNQSSKEMLIGKAFFASGEGITGWVYKNNKPLRINNVVNENETKSISPDLYWANEYQEGEDLYEPGEKRSLLAIPLILDNQPIGVLKFHATTNKQPFSEVSQEIATIVSQIIAGVLRQTWRVAEQSQTISRLIETSNKSTPLEVIADVTKSMKEIINCSRSEYFTRSQDGTVLKLVIRDGHQVPKPEQLEFARGESLVGWVFKTGLPVMIPDIKQFVPSFQFDNVLLEKISIGVEINDADRFLEFDVSPYLGESKLQLVSFIAVPVKSKNQEVHGVLCGYRNVSVKARRPFEHSELMSVTSLASTIALAIENNQQRMLGNLLIELGYLTQTDQLFEIVTSNIPKLVASSGCSIFTSVVRRGTPRLKLAYTSQEGLVLEDGKIPHVEYEFGEAKTGICALFQSTLVANHYGNGKVSLERIDKEVQRISLDHPDDITSILTDSSDSKVGLFHMVVDEKLSIAKGVAIRNFAKTVVFQSTGIISQKLDPYTLEKSGGTWSFIAVPISSDDKLLGVITLPRPVPESPFLASDISLLRSIAGRLASVLNNLRIIEQREQLVMSLAHEINTPLTGILADSQNILIEVPKNTELQNLAEHNLGQVQRLHMQASAIMSVLSEGRSALHFNKHSIFHPLKEACELFASEASQRGCDILGPRAQDGEFPVIEMSLFDLKIAFQNIIHNAVKYSFRPPTKMDSKRTIQVWGQKNKNRGGFYDIFVQNYGVGISPHEIEKRLIFEPYYRGERASERKRTGSGFGLAYARLVIEDMHNGYINVSSLHQGGDAYLTTFAISLPIKQQR